eukprot:Em0015g810a
MHVILNRGTLLQLKNLIHKTSVPRDPKNVYAAEEFLKVVVSGHICNNEAILSTPDVPEEYMEYSLKERWIVLQTAIECLVKKHVDFSLDDRKHGEIPMSSQGCRLKRNPALIRNAILRISKGHSLNSVAKAAGIPEASMRHYNSKPEMIDRPIGPKTLLTDEEELGLATAALWLKERGLPLDALQLKCSAKDNIGNLDETFIRFDLKSRKVIAERNAKSVYQLSSIVEEQLEHITVVAFVTTNGDHLSNTDGFCFVLMVTAATSNLRLLNFVVNTSAVPKEKLSPNLAVRAAACDPTAHLTSFGVSSTPTLPAVLGAPKRRLDLHKHGLSWVEKLQIENRELKRALCALNVVEQLHPEQVGKKNATEHEPRRAGIIRAAGAQHATADEWIRTMEEEDALQEQKKHKAEQRAKAREEQQVQRAQERSAKQQCTAVFKSGKRKGQQCLPNANAQLILLQAP